MKYIVLIIGVVIFGWGAWVLSTDQGSKMALNGVAACEQVYQGQTQSALDRTKCDSNALQSGRDLSNRAIWAILIGGVIAAISGTMVRHERQNLKGNASL